MTRYIFLLAPLILAGLGIEAPASAQSPPLSYFLARCDTDQTFCQDEVSRVERMSNMIPGANCPPQDMSIETMTTEVVAKSKEPIEETPDNASVSADMAIEQILPVLWPCQ